MGVFGARVITVLLTARPRKYVLCCVYLVCLVIIKVIFVI